MIVTNSPFTYRAEALKPSFYNVTTCKCGRALYQHAYVAEFKKNWDIEEGWFHDDTESEFCSPQYAALRDDFNQDSTKAEPVFGPLNLELYWQPA